MAKSWQIVEEYGEFAGIFILEIFSIARWMNSSSSLYLTRTQQIHASSEQGSVPYGVWNQSHTSQV